MGIVEIIRAALWQDKEAGLNQSEIARKYNLTQQTVNRIFHDKINLAKLEINTFIRMFPDAEIILHERVGDNPADTVYPVVKHPEYAKVKPLEQQQNLSHFDRAMLEEWNRLDRLEKSRVMGFMAQLELEREECSSTA